MNTQPEALRLADELEAMFGKTDIDERVCKELRRLHKENRELRRVLYDVEPYDGCVAIVNEGMGGIEWLDKPLPDDTPLYTAPPKREWVGLTDEEIDDWFFQRLKQVGAGWRLDDVIRAVEAKLKEKNE